MLVLDCLSNSSLPSHLMLVKAYPDHKEQIAMVLLLPRIIKLLRRGKEAPSRRSSWDSWRGNVTNNVFSSWAACFERIVTMPTEQIWQGFSLRFMLVDFALVTDYAAHFGAFSHQMTTVYMVHHCMFDHRQIHKILLRMYCRYVFGNSPAASVWTLSSTLC